MKIGELLEEMETRGLITSDEKKEIALEIGRDIVRKFQLEMNLKSMQELNKRIISIGV